MWITPSLRIGTAALAAVIILLTPWGADGVKELARRNSPHTINFRTKDDAALTDWALSRFEQAGLALPPLTISFHDDKQRCDGHFGSYRLTTSARVDICGFNGDRFLMKPKATLLHELGHAWADYTLDEATRQRFLRFRGLTAWSDDDTPWEEKGSEHAAEIIAWALMDQDLLMTLIRAFDPGTLAQGYVLLTGSLPVPRTRARLSLHHVASWKS